MESSEADLLFADLTRMKKEIEAGNDNDLSLLEKRLLVLVRLRRFTTVIEEGYRILGKQGPQPFVYKCILVALCRTGKTDECRQVLDRWKRSSPKDPVRKDIKSKVEAFLNAVDKSGVDPFNSFIYLEKSLGLTEEWVFRNCDEPIGKWRFRTPPRQHSVKYTLCPTPIDCFYGNDCPNAHSSDELEEWTLRMESIGFNFFDMSSNAIKPLDPIGSNKYRGNFTSTRGPRLINGPPMSNGALHVQNGLYTTTQTFQFSNGRTVTTNCYTNSNENQFNQNYVIPTNLPYLNELITKYKTSLDLSTLFLNELDDVTFKSIGPLSVKSKNRLHHWSFALRSREALRTVSLLHDENRCHFYISDATFYYGPRQLNLKNLHAVNRNNGLQVLNTFIPSDIIKEYGGWPQWFYYKIDVSFRTELPGQYRQAIVFDFKKDPKLLKDIKIEVGEFEELESASGSTSPEGSVRVVVVDSNSGFPIENGGWSSTTRAKEGKSVHLNKLNYVQEMTKILGQEISCRQSELKKLDRFQDLTPTYISVAEGENKIENQLYCTIDFGNSLSEDSSVGKLIRSSCDQVLLTASDYPSRSYMCAITEKLRGSIVISLGKAIVQDLGLKVDRAYNFKIELNLDVKYFDKMKKTLNCISDCELELLFPDFIQKTVFEHDLLNIFLEGAFSLSQRQMNAYTAITNSVVGAVCIPPIIVTGAFGTGKTYTLCQSVRKLLQCNQKSRILICTNTNSAADIYITSLDEYKNPDYRALRMYCQDKRVEDVSDVVKKYCTLDSTGQFRYPTKEEICNNRVVVITLNTSPELLRIGVEKSHFTHIFIDGATQVLETEAIEPFLLANLNSRIVLAGDHMQLARDLFSPQGIASPNILERLESLYPNVHPCRIMLTENYRTQEKILKFTAQHFYSGPVCCATIQPTHPHLYPLTFFSVRGEESPGQTSYFNSAEIQELGTRLEFIIKFWPPQWGDVQDPSSIVILTPYADQVERIQSHLKSRNLSYISVERVQKVQGKQFRVVFISTVRTVISSSDPERDLGFLSNIKMFNTAMTRAQSLVAVVGDPVSLCSTGKCRTIWLAFIQEAMLNHALHGIQYEQLRVTLAEMERKNGKVNAVVNSEYIAPNFPIPTAQQTKPTSAPLPQPTFNSFYSNFGPSPLTTPPLSNNLKIESPSPPPYMGVFPPVTTSNFGTDNVQRNFNQLSIQRGSSPFDNFASNSQSPLGLNNINFAPTSFYQDVQAPPTSNFNNNLSRASGFAMVQPPIQRNIPIQNGHSNLNGIIPEFGIRAQLSHPPGFSERPGIIGMNTSVNYIAKPGLGSFPTSPTITKELNVTNVTSMVTTSSGGLGSASITRNIPVSSPTPTPVGAEKAKQATKNANKTSSPTFSFPLDDFPSLTPEPVKKPSDWIEVKPKKPKPQANNNNGKPKDGSEKTVDEKIETLVSMGFEKKRAIKALQMTERDLEKAMELLLAGKEKIGKLG